MKRYYTWNLQFVVQVWDPFTGDTVRQLESSSYSPVIALAPLPRPSSLVVTATTDNTLRWEESFSVNSMIKIHLSKIDM